MYSDFQKMKSYLLITGDSFNPAILLTTNPTHYIAELRYNY